MSTTEQTWTREQHETARGELAGGLSLSVVGQRMMLAEIERTWGEIERITREREELLTEARESTNTIGELRASRHHVNITCRCGRTLRVTSGVDGCQAVNEMPEESATEDERAQQDVAAERDHWRKTAGAMKAHAASALRNGVVPADALWGIVEMLPQPTDADLPADAPAAEDEQAHVRALPSDERASRPAPSTLDREALGRIVRDEWIAWAREQPSPKESWLVPWEGLSEPDREVDRRIGERLYSVGVLSGEHATEMSPLTEGEAHALAARVQRACMDLSPAAQIQAWRSVILSASRGDIPPEVRASQPSGPVDDVPELWEAFRPLLRRVAEGDRSEVAIDQLCAMWRNALIRGQLVDDRALEGGQ